MATDALRARRLAEVAELRLAIQWAVLHGHPRDEGERRDPMVIPGGDGTPSVREHAIPELAMARRGYAARIAGCASRECDRCRHRCD